MNAAYRRLWATGIGGWKTLCFLRRSAPSWEDVLELQSEIDSARLRACVRRALRAEDPLPAWERKRWVFLAPGNPLFPTQWLHIPSPPGGVLLAGDAHALQQPCVAIIGTRRPTPYGVHVARSLAREAVRAGATVLAGLATGIDTEAHAAALDAGGCTIAILPTSLDAIYPRSNRRLAERIAHAGGALLSEYTSQAIPRAQTFHARNRLVAGLATRIVVVEAGESSGTMRTVEFALELGRDIAAVPGPITSPQSIGTNRLIAEGAEPILRLDEVPAMSSYAAHPVLQTLHRNIHDLDGIAADTGIPMPELLAQLTALELDGVIRRSGRGYTLR